MKRQLNSRLTPMVATSTSESDSHILVNVGARIKVARKALGMTQDELAALAGARSKSGLQDNEAGKNMPGGHMLGALVKAGVNANWLLSGKGKMLLADTTETTVKVDLDKERLSESIETVEFVLTSAKRTMVSEKKVELIMAVYDLLDDQEETKERILRLIKSAG